MASQPPKASGDGSNPPHTLGLRVLRLSAPSLATQTVLPFSTEKDALAIPDVASYASPSLARNETTNPLTSLLVLPSTFGTAYVGENFACAFCLIKERASLRNEVVVSDVQVTGEIQSQKQATGIPLELKVIEENAEANGIEHQSSFIHKLKEEGPHMLVVTASYTETERAENESAGAGEHRRTFRKLYQFAVQPLITVRTKITEQYSTDSSNVSRRWYLEAQMENIGETATVIDAIQLILKTGIQGRECRSNRSEERAVLKPKEIVQRMFVLQSQGEILVDQAFDPTGRMALAQLKISWQTAMGHVGSMTSGWLSSRAP